MNQSNTSGDGVLFTLKLFENIFCIFFRIWNNDNRLFVIFGVLGFKDSFINLFIIDQLFFQNHRPNPLHHIDLWHVSCRLTSGDTGFITQGHFWPSGIVIACICVCVHVCMCVCQSVCQSLACPRDNSGPVQARITKFGPKMQKTLVKVPIVLGGNWP